MQSNCRTTSIVDRMRPIIDKTITSLARTKFRLDPIGGVEYSASTSVISAAYKRHGRILEEAIRLRLSDCPYFTVWQEPRFVISRPADQVVSGRNAEIEDSLLIDLPYLTEGRMVQVDTIVFDERVRVVRAYEIKRANGDIDAGKKRSILKDILSVQALLKSYAAKHGHVANVAEARVIAYYGLKPLPEPLCLSGTEIDDHFVFPVFEQVQEVNAYFKAQLFALLDKMKPGCCFDAPSSSTGQSAFQFVD